jgi:Novel STAND NTPase 1/Sel1 repeat
MNAKPAIALERPARPYPGLRPFEANEWSIFFGRERMIDEVIERLAVNNLVLIHGASGSGKSSLVRAGVLPKLERQHQRRGAPWLTGKMRPSGGPLWNLAAEFARLEGSDGDSKRIATIVGQFSARDASLVSIVGGLDGLAGKSLCVLVDQFEELFRFEKHTSREEAEVFVDLIVRAAAADESTSTKVHVIVTMRSEFLGECARFDGLAEAINQTQYLVPRMDDDALMRAVCRPATLFGGVVDDGLARRLIGSVRGRVDELPLLQHGLMLMWAEAVKRTPPDQRVVLDGAIVDKAGGLAGLLSEHADAVTAAVAPDPSSGRIVERVFRELTDVSAENSAIRRPRRFADLAAATGASPEQLRAIIDAFRAPDVAFLTPYAPAPIEAATEIDISHEALIRNWRRVSLDNDGWLKQEFDDGLAWRSLLTEAEAFEKDPALVLSPAATKYRSGLYEMHNEHWSLRYGGGWPLVGGLLEASRNAAAQARKKEALARKKDQRAHAWIASLAVVALAAAVVMCAIWLKERHAVTAERAAVKLAEVDETSLRSKDASLQEALKQDDTDKAKLRSELDREKILLAQVERTKENLEQEEKKLTEEKKQLEDADKLAETFFIGLTKSGRDCPSMTPDADLVEKTKLVAEQGNGSADFFLGLLFQCGFGVPKSVTEAVRWHTKAADLGNPIAMRTLGLLSQSGMGGPLDVMKARDWYLKAADKGDGVAMTMIGSFYYFGRGGVSLDYGQARGWFQKAADAAVAEAMTFLGYSYEYGQGVSPDYAQARTWYEKAADARNPEAMERLGAFFALGKSGPRDKAKAQEWFKKASDAGDLKAKRDLVNFDFLSQLEAARTAYMTKNYPEEVRLDKELAVEIEADERRKTRSAGPRTAEALGYLAGDELMTRDFSGALAAAERAHKLAPDKIWIETNHAHALAFLGHLPEAKEIYLSHREEDDGLGAGSTWREDVVEDFADFRGARLPYPAPLMQEIEAKLSSGDK